MVVSNIRWFHFLWMPVCRICRQTGIFLFPYFENCGDNKLLCGNMKRNVVTMW